MAERSTDGRELTDYNLTGGLSGKSFRVVFRRRSVRISAGISAILYEAFEGFLRKIPE
jgi:hypothetical protein